jgi:hypothetical protein
MLTIALASALASWIAPHISFLALNSHTLLSLQNELDVYDGNWKRLEDCHPETWPRTISKQIVLFSEKDSLHGKIQGKAPPFLSMIRKREETCNHIFFIFYYFSFVNYSIKTYFTESRSKSRFVVSLQTRRSWAFQQLRIDISQKKERIYSIFNQIRFRHEKLFVIWNQNDKSDEMSLTKSIWWCHAILWVRGSDMLGRWEYNWAIFL